MAPTSCLNRPRCSSMASPTGASTRTDQISLPAGTPTLEFTQKATPVACFHTVISQLRKLQLILYQMAHEKT